MYRNLYLIITALILLFGQSATSVRAEGAAPEISVDAKYIDLGYIPFDFNFVHYYTIKNIGSANLHITKLVPNCDCTYAIPSDTIVMPDSTADVKIVFGTEQYYGPNTRHIEVHSNDPKNPLIYLEYASNIGAYPKYFKINPVSLFFLPGQTKRKISLANLSKEDVEFEILLEKDSLFTLSAYTGKIDGVPYELTVYPKENLQKGSHETNFTIVYKTKSEQKITVPMKIVR